MRERAERLRRVRDIIKEHRITSQEMLLGHLKRQGFNLTQATLSRDLKVLKVSKVSEGSSGYYYTLPTEEELRESEQNYVLDLKRGMLSMEFSGNLGIIHTMPAHADTVAIALDNLSMSEILGTIAGDDTVLVVLRAGADSADFAAELISLVPELGE